MKPFDCLPTDGHVAVVGRRRTGKVAIAKRLITQWLPHVGRVHVVTRRPGEWYDTKASVLPEHMLESMLEVQSYLAKYHHDKNCNVNAVRPMPACDRLLVVLDHVDRETLYRLDRLFINGVASGICSITVCQVPNGFPPAVRPQLTLLIATGLGSFRNAEKMYQQFVDHDTWSSAQWHSFVQASVHTFRSVLCVDRTQLPHRVFAHTLYEDFEQPMASEVKS